MAAHAHNTPTPDHHTRRRRKGLNPYLPPKGYAPAPRTRSPTPDEADDDAPPPPKDVLHIDADPMTCKPSQFLDSLVGAHYTAAEVNRMRAILDSFNRPPARDNIDDQGQLI